MTTRSIPARAEILKRSTSAATNLLKKKPARSLCNLHSVQESTSGKRASVFFDNKKFDSSKSKLASTKKLSEVVSRKLPPKSSIASNRIHDSSIPSSKQTKPHSYLTSNATITNNCKILRKKKPPSPKEINKCSYSYSSRPSSKSTGIVSNVTRTRMLKHFDPMQKSVGEHLKTSFIPRPRTPYLYSGVSKESYVKTKSSKEPKTLDYRRINVTNYRPNQSDTNIKKTIKKCQHTREVRTTDSVVQYNTFPKRNAKDPVVEISDMKSSICSDCSYSELSLRCLQMYLAEKRPVTNSRFRNGKHQSCIWHANKATIMQDSGSLIESPRKFLSRLILDRTKSLTSLFETNATSSIKIRRNGSLQNLNREKSDRHNGKFWRKIPLSDSKSAIVLKRPADDNEGYHQRVVEILHSKKKSTRFKNLLYFFTNLERIGELERITSRWYLPPILGTQQNMNYDLWKQIRSKERANRELKSLYEKVKTAKLDNDILFCATDVDKFKWRGDFALRRKNRSVESIREHFQNLGSEKEVKRTVHRRFTSCPERALSRNTSVMDITKKFSDDSSLKSNCQKFSSSLSLEQVTALKNELNEIYESGNRAAKDLTVSSECYMGTARSRSSTINARSKTKPTEDNKKTIVGTLQGKHELTASMQRRSSGDRGKRKSLHVRCNSMSATTPPKGYNPMHRRGSISRMATSEKPKNTDKTASSPNIKMQELFPDLKSHPKIQKIINSTEETTVPETPPLSKTLNYVSTTKYVDSKTHDEVGSTVKEKRNLLRFRFPNNFFSAQKLRLENTMKNRSKKNESLECKSPIIEPVENAPVVLPNSEISNTAADVKCEPHKSESVLQTCQMFEKKGKSKWSLNYNKFMTGGQVSKFKMAPRSAPSSKSFIDLKELFGEISSIKYSTLPIYRSSENNST